MLSISNFINFFILYYLSLFIIIVYKKRIKKKNYLVTLDILKNNMDDLLKVYKDTKQIILKKLKSKENFWKSKEKFIKDFYSENISKIQKNNPNLANITKMIYFIPNPISSNFSNISNFAGSLSSSLKKTLYDKSIFETQPSNIKTPNKNQESSQDQSNFSL